MSELNEKIKYLKDQSKSFGPEMEKRCEEICKETIPDPLNDDDL